MSTLNVFKIAVATSVLAGCATLGIATAEAKTIDGFPITASIFHNEKLDKIRTTEALTIPVETLNSHKSTALQTLVNTFDSATAHVSDSGGVTNATLETLTAQVQAEVALQKNLINADNIFGLAMSLPVPAFTFVEVDKYVTEHTAPVATLLTSWDTELAAEKQRIAEAEAQAAAEAEANARNQYVPRAGESQEMRLQRIASEVGVSVRVFIGEGCGNVPVPAGWAVAGCFSTATNAINVTKVGLSRGDNNLRCTLMHENRHAWQYANGMFNRQSGESEDAARARLESDADANSC